MTENLLRILPTDAPPGEGAHLVDDFTPALIDVGAHNLCPGCGEPIAMRSVMEVIAEQDLVQKAIAVFGIGCYTAFSNNLDCEVLQALHGRAPSLATGVKRARPDTVVITIQGDGDMVNEGLQEVVHAAARGESITCVLLNNGVFGETGGHMTATTTLGQRTKNSLEGRNAADHGYPIQMAALLAGLEGSAYVARGAVQKLPRIELKCIEPGPYLAPAYEGRLGQVVRYLIDNAISFSPPDGSIAVAVRREPRHVVFSVTDDGPGIPPENLESIFDRFYSERPASEAFGQHSGLGLPIARQIVQSLGGQIHAENRDDGQSGARFTVRLPL